MRRMLFLTAGLTLTGILSGCGVNVGTPEQAALQFFTALSSEDYGRAYELLSRKHKETQARELKELAAKDDQPATARLNTAFNLNLDAARLGGVSGREFFKEAVQGARARDKELERLLSEAPKVKAGNGAMATDNARVEVVFADGTTRMVRCAREDGNWRVDPSQ